jgi:hypothetical protein
MRNQQKAFDKYDTQYCKEHLRNDGWSWFMEFQWTDRYGITVRRKLMLQGRDLDLLAAQASERARCVMTLGWNAMFTKYYFCDPTIGEHLDRCLGILTVGPRTFAQYENALLYIVGRLVGFADLDGPYKFGKGRDARARKKLLYERKLSDLTLVGLRKFAKLPNAKAHLPYASCLFTPKIMQTLYGENLRRPWPFVEFTSNQPVLRPLARFQEPEDHF